MRTYGQIDRRGLHSGRRTNKEGRRETVDHLTMMQSGAVQCSDRILFSPFNIRLVIHPSIVFLFFSALHRLGLIKLLTKELDFCEESAKIDKPCPLKAGDQYLYHEVELPKEIPPVRPFLLTAYTVLCSI